MVSIASRETFRLFSSLPFFLLSDVLISCNLNIVTCGQVNRFESNSCANLLHCKQSLSILLATGSDRLYWQIQMGTLWSVDRGGQACD